MLTEHVPVSLYHAVYQGTQKQSDVSNVTILTMEATKVMIPPGTDINQNVALEKLRIDPTVEINEPPVYCKIGDAPAMTAGNFSLINGKAKSGKTFLTGAVVASMLTGSEQLGVIRGSLPDDKQTVLYFDTEQSPFHAARTIKRICQLTNDPDPANLQAYGLRPLTPAERLQAIEDKISSTDNLGAVVIDGIRDLLTIGINDEAEATSLTSKFLRWTADYSIHIILLLHQNKTDLNARGHIGTEVLNKAETTLTVTKDDRTGVFVVTCDYSRDISFADFGFTINEGVPDASDLPQDERAKTKNPALIKDDIHFQVLSRIFKDRKPMQYRELQDGIIYGFEGAFGLNASRTFISHYAGKGWISKTRDANKTFYNYERAVF